MSSDPHPLRVADGDLSAVLPQLPPEILEAKVQALRAALGAQQLSVARRLLPPTPDEAHPPFEILITVGSATGVEAEPPPPQAFDRVLAEGCSFHLQGSAGGALSTWLSQQGGGALCGWALPRDRWPSIALLARVPHAWDPGPVRMRVARRGMEALARSLSPPSWWLRSNPSTVPAAQAAELPERVETPSSLRESKLLVERELLQQALRNSRGNKTEAARRLQLSRQGLYRKLRRHGLHPGTKEPGEGRQSRGRRL
jgi:hypothetical protein